MIEDNTYWKSLDMNFSGRQWDEQEILELTLKEAD